MEWHTKMLSAGVAMLIAQHLWADLPDTIDVGELPSTRALRYQGNASAMATTHTTALDTNAKKIAELLAAKAPEGSIADRRAFWYSQYDQVSQLGNPIALRQIIERALADLQGYKEGEDFFRTRLWQLIRAIGTRSEVLAMGEDIVARYPKNYPQITLLIKEYARFHDFSRAEALLEKSQSVLASFRRSAFDQQNAEAARLNTLGFLAAQRGQLDEAIKYYSNAVSIADWVGDIDNIPANQKRNYPLFRLHIVSYRQLLIDVLIRAGALEQARIKLAEVEKITAQLKLEGTERIALLRLRAQLEMAAGHFKQALATLQDAEKQYRQLGLTENTRWVINIHSNQITALIALGKVREAADILRALDAQVSKDQLSHTALDRGMLLWQQGQLENALQEVTALSKENRTLYTVDHYFILRDTALLQAITYQQQPTPEGLAQLGALSEKLLADRSALASDAVQKAYRRIILTAYLQGLASTTNREAAAIETGFHIAEALRDSVVGDVVTQAAMRSAGRQPGLSALVSRQRNLKLEIDASYTNLANAQSSSDRDEKVMASLRLALRKQQDEQVQIEKDLSRRFPEYSQLTNAEPARLKDVMRLLNRNEVLVSILPTNDASYVWVLTRDRPPVFFASKLNTTKVNELVGRVRQTLDVGTQLRTQIPAFDQAAARQLYAELLAPARGITTGRTHLIINTAGALAQLPFSTLLTGSDTAQGPSWLVREHAVTHIPSIGSFASLRQTNFRTAASRPFIGFGDPLFGVESTPAVQVAALTRNLALPRTTPQDDLAGALKNYGQIPPLPETRAELLAIAGALGADREKDVFLGKAATRNAVLNASLADYQVVSFATHGLMAGDLPGLNQPALALASSNVPGESPLLTLEDVLDLKLNADWVVLSACNTASADGEASEALSGLGRGFFYAGARALLVTHWAVESASAQQLVTATFKRYGEDKSVSRSESLRKAQLELINGKQYTHPFYWAPYALVGDGG